MFWKRASGKLVFKPWKAENISVLRYGFKEIPEVISIGLITFAIVIPGLFYHYSQIGKDAYSGSSHKLYFTVMRPEQMPIEGHQYCTKSSSSSS